MERHFISKRLLQSEGLTRLSNGSNLDPILLYKAHLLGISTSSNTSRKTDEQICGGGSFVQQNKRFRLTFLAAA